MTEITGCYSDTTLELFVQIPPPVSNPPNLEYCDASQYSRLGGLLTGGGI